MTVTKEALDALALSEAEYEAIVERLGREPNELELGMFGSLWSEHCGYKHSKPLLRMFDGQSPRLLVSAGDENAGAVDIGDGLAVVFKIESHNHPSAIEPFEGAATGVGGIVRDIFAMGARPIALLNSLRFAPPSDARNRYLFEGVVAGISSYGNCIGIPNVGGEVVFSPSYSGNPLVNAMCVGLVEVDRLMRATTGPPGSVMMLVGSETGRDGIHGASGLASRTFEDEREMRPAVQVSNPFLEKVLIEACLEAAASGHVVGLQDLGAAGLTSASVEAAGNGGCGFDLEVSDVPRRESGMTPYEVMLSESQERMLLFVKEDSVDEVRSIFERWDCPATVIGRATEGRNATIYERGVPRGEAPVRTLRDAPQYRLDGAEPAWQAELQGYDLDSVPLPEESPSLVLLRLLASPNIASKEPVYRQYDHHVQLNTVAEPGADAAVLRIKGTKKGLALATDGNGRYCYLDPYAGGMIAVAEACRNVSAMGAEPVALTNCLNFGNPERGRRLLPAREVRRGHGGGQPGPWRSRGQRQREPLQRDQGRGHIPDPHRRRVGPVRGCVDTRHARVRGRGRRHRPHWRGGARGSSRLAGRQRVPGAGARPRGRTSGPGHRPGDGRPARVPGGRRPAPAALRARLLRRWPRDCHSRVMHPRRHRSEDRRAHSRSLGRRPLRRSPVKDRGIAGP